LICKLGEHSKCVVDTKEFVTFAAVDHGYKEGNTGTLDRYLYGIAA
jgi:hypothetical protein